MSLAVEVIAQMAVTTKYLNLAVEVIPQMAVITKYLNLAVEVIAQMAVTTKYLNLAVEVIAQMAVTTKYLNLYGCNNSIERLHCKISMRMVSFEDLDLLYFRVTLLRSSDHKFQKVQRLILFYYCIDNYNIEVTK